MRICFSIQPQAPELQSRHFGESGHFLVFDSEAGRFQPHRRAAQSCTRPCQCPLPELEGVDLVICHRIGHAALQQLRRRGVTVLQGDDAELRQLLARWQQQTLPPLLRGSCLLERRPPRGRMSLESGHA